MIATQQLFLKTRGLRAISAVIAVLLASITALSSVSVAGAASNAPQATWNSSSGRCSGSDGLPIGTMTSDGTNVWAPLNGSQIAEVKPSTNDFSCWSDLSLANNYGNLGTLTATPGIAYANGSVWASGHNGSNIPYLIRINPLASGGPAITGEWPLTNTPAFAAQILFDGTSLWLRLGDGSLLKVDPTATGTPSVTPITGEPGLVSAEALVGSNLWLAYGTGSSDGLAEYAVNSSTTVLRQPLVTTTTVNYVFSMSADSTHLWLLSVHRLDELNLSDGSVVNAGIDAGVNTTMVAADGTYTWVAGGSSAPGTLTGFLSSDPSSSTTIDLTLPPPTNGGAASGVYFDGTNVWAAEYLDATIERLMAYPSAPVITGATVQKNGDATLTWTPPSVSGNAPVSDYTVGISPSQGVSISETSMSSVVYHGLKSGTTYTLKVRASNGAYLGPWATTTVSVAPVPSVAHSVSELAKTGSPFGPLLGSSAALTVAGVLLLRRRRSIS